MYKKLYSNQVSSPTKRKKYKEEKYSTLKEEESI